MLVLYYYFASRLDYPGWTGDKRLWLSEKAGVREAGRGSPRGSQHCGRGGRRKLGG